MKYTTVAVLCLQEGAVLGLTDPQVATRSHALDSLPSRKGWYTATAPVQFKIEEEIQIDGDLPPSLARQLQASAKARRSSADQANLQS